jgi:sporulation protein YlmC with PRC-barrel domain
MTVTIQQLYGKALAASDGEVGSIKDFYFNDQQWAIRYVIVDTGSWLPGRQVLLSPHAFRSVYHKEDSLQVILTRQQIENSPTIAAHKPVSRQFEEEYYRYYGWPYYWDGGGMWGVGGQPVTPWPYLMPDQQTTPPGAPLSSGDDPHLRSTQAMNGYHIQASDGSIGHVTDFVMDGENWVIRQLVVQTGHWFSSKEIVLSPQDVHRISYEESTVYVSKTKEAISAAPEYHVSPLDAG